MKIKKYEHASELNNLIFLPLVITTNGQWGDKVDDLVSGLCKLVTERYSDQPKSKLSQMISNWRSR